MRHEGHSITECEDRKCELPLDLEEPPEWEEEELLRRLSDEDASC